MENFNEIIYDIKSELKYKFLEYTKEYDTVLIADFDSALIYASKKAKEYGNI